MKLITIRLISFTVIMSSSIAISFGQQDAMFTHYLFNMLNSNPAYAGSRDVLSVVALSRSQWGGFEGAPRTQTISLHSPIFSKSLSAGLTMCLDKIGPTQLTSSNFDISYRTKISSKGTLAFGIKAGANFYNIDLNSLDLTTQADQSFSNNFTSNLALNLGAGTFLQFPKFYVGFSVPRINQNNLNQSSIASRSLPSLQRHYYLISGGILKISNRLAFRPSSHLKITLGAPVQFDFTSLLILDDFVWAGAMLRSGDALGLLVGLNISKRLQFGYSYDWSFGLGLDKLSKSNSHEFMLRYELFSKKKRIRSPRYF